MSELQSYEVETVVRGSHVYGADCEGPVRQILPCQREGGNIHDPYAITVVEKGVTVAHLPQVVTVESGPSGFGNNVSARGWKYLSNRIFSMSEQ